MFYFAEDIPDVPVGLHPLAIGAIVFAILMLLLLLTSFTRFFRDEKKPGK